MQDMKDIQNNGIRPGEVEKKCPIYFLNKLYIF